MGPSWDDLRFLLLAQREGSLQRAARSLGVDATTVGRRIGALEKQLGTRLIKRVPEGVRVTESVSALSAFAEEMERKLARVSRALSGSDQRISGRVRVTAGDGFLPLLIQVAKRLRSVHPQLELDLTLDRRVHDLMRGESDLALRTVRPQETSLAAKRLGSIAFGLYANQSYLAQAGQPRSVEALRSHALVGFSEELAAAPEMRWLKQHELTRFSVRVNSSAGLLEAACAGLGVAPVAHPAAALHGQLVRVLPEEELGKIWLWLVYRAEERSSPRVRAVTQALLDELSAQRALLQS